MVTLCSVGTVPDACLGARAGDMFNTDGSDSRGTEPMRLRFVTTGSTISAGVYKTIAEAERAVVALRNELFTHSQLDRMS